MTGEKEAINLALIGAGGMGKRWARALDGFSDITISKVCDIDLACAETLAGELSSCTSTDTWETILHDTAIEGVIVALPHHILYEASKAALRAGKHVLSEKPGAKSPEEIDELRALAKDNNVEYMVCFNHRYHDGFLKMKETFCGGVIGEPHFVRARYGFGGRSGYESEWRLDPEISGGGELIDQGVHMIDLARLYLGDFKEVRGVTANYHYKAKGEDNAFALLKTSEGKVASIHVSLTNWKPIHSFELYGDTGYLIVEGLGRKYGGKEVLRVGIRPEGEYSDIREEVIECNNDADQSLRNAARTFLENMKNEERTYESTNDAIEVLSIVKEIYSQNEQQ